MKNQTRRGFTLIEILVVVAIIGILATIILASIDQARKNSRDKVRMSDLEQAKAALQIYATANNTYAVAGTGQGGGGVGYFSFAGGYPKSVVQGLIDAGLLTTAIHDPMVPIDQVLVNGQRAYMIYFHATGPTDGVCLFAQLERPNAGTDATMTNAPIAASTRTSLQTSYGINYATCTP